MKRLRIKDIFKPVGLISDGYDTFFNDFTTYEDLNEFINGDNVSDLTSDYFISHSGDKYLSKLFYEIMDYYRDSLGYTWEDILSRDDNYDYCDDLFDNVASKLSSIIYNRFGAKWIKIYNALNESYNPLHNYDMSETRTPNLTETRTPNITRGENASTTSSTDVENGVYGFNSTNSNPSTDSTGSQTDTMNRTSTETGTETKKNTGTETLTRSGNIGVTSSQQLLESELELRKYDFYQMIYNDIDTILCLKIY